MTERAGHRLVDKSVPSFLIVGYMKCGTSALATHLRSHPEIHMPERELHFFTKDELYNRGFDYYKSLFANLPSTGIKGEKSPSYSRLPQVSARRIATHMPDARLIWLFRNPVDRAYSHYWSFVAKRKERESFERALELEAERTKTDSAFGYRSTGEYVKDVIQFLDYFPREQCLFLTSNQLYSDTQGTLETVCRFLNVEAMTTFQNMARKVHKTEAPRSIRLHFLLGQLNNYPTRVRNLLKKLNQRSSGSYPPMYPQTRTSLTRYYAPFNVELMEITGLDLTKWLS